MLKELGVMLVLLLARHSFCCFQGSTGVGTNCKVCPAGLTTAGDGDNLPCNRCQIGYVGKAPFCKQCSSDFSATSVNGKCACEQGWGGTYPNCKFCTPGLSTPKAGNGQKCGCTQPKPFADDYMDVAYGCAKCDNSVGFYKPDLAFWPKTINLPAGNVCIRCNKASNGFVKDVKGVKFCSCDRSQGYSYKWSLRGPAGGGYCTKCSGEGQQIDSQGRCVCKKGYALSRSFFEDNYCIPCGDGKTNSVDKSGQCQCKPGYAFDANGIKCLPCTGPSFLANKEGTCQCKPGYFGSVAFFSFPGSSPPSCGKCAAGMTSEIRGGNPVSVCICADKAAGIINPGQYEKGCKCRWGFKQVANHKCTTNAYCKSGTYVVEFWSGAQLPKTWNGKSFPKAVLSLKPTARKLVKEAAKTAAFTLVAADVPAGVDKAKFVARIRRCSCVFHASEASQFVASFKVQGAGGAVLTIDGGQKGRCGGDYHDQNMCLRPRVDPVIPVRGSIQTSTSKALSVIFPIYFDEPGGFTSGMDYIPIMRNYQACHNITLAYWHTGKAGAVKLQIPKETIY